MPNDVNENGKVPPPSPVDQVAVSTNVSTAAKAKSVVHEYAKCTPDPAGSKNNA